jgi:hypothetical protein
MSEFEGVTDPQLKLRQWEYQAYISCGMLGEWEEAEKFRLSALARCGGNVNELKATPRMLLMTYDKKRRRAISLPQDSAASLTGVLLSRVSSSKISNTPVMMDVFPFSCSHTLINHCTLYVIAMGAEEKSTQFCVLS